MPTRDTVDLSAYPDLVVIYLGMRVNALRGIRTVLGLGPGIRAVGQSDADGLLLHENVFYGLRHVGMRQYWRDFDALEAWTRTRPHADWWKSFVKDSGGTGFWHETYMLRGGMESIYMDMPPTGFSAFAPALPATGAEYSLRRRARRG